MTLTLGLIIFVVGLAGVSIVVIYLLMGLSDFPRRVALGNVIVSMFAFITWILQLSPYMDAFAAIIGFTAAAIAATCTARPVAEKSWEISTSPNAE